MSDDSKYKSMKSQAIYSLFNDAIKKVYDKYYWFFMNSGVFKQYVLNTIEITKNDNYSDYKEYLIDYLIQRSIPKVQKLLIDETKVISLINSYVLGKFKYLKNYNKVSECLLELDSFLNLYDYMLPQNIIIELLDNNLVFNKAVSIVFEHNKDKIVEGKCSEIFNSPFLVMLMETYASVNNIEINSSQEDVTEEDINTIIELGKESTSEEILGDTSLNDNDGELEESSGEEQIENNLVQTFDQKAIKQRKSKYVSYDADDIVGDYLREIDNYPRLSDEEEIKYSLLTQQGDLDARKKMAEGNLRLVVSRAKKKIGRGLPFIDLIQDGNEGLMKAILKFDPAKGFKFSTYATWWIDQAITRAIYNNSRTVKLPVNFQEDMKTYFEEKRQLSYRLKKTPTRDDVKYFLGYTDEQIDAYEMYQADELSLNRSVDRDDANGSEAIDFLQDTSVNVADDVGANILREELLELLDKAFQTPSDKRKLYVFIRINGLDGQPEEKKVELAARLNLSGERIRQIEAEAIKKIIMSKTLSDEYAQFTDNPKNFIRMANELRKEYQRDRRNDFGETRNSIVDEVNITFDKMVERIISILSKEYDRKLLFVIMRVHGLDGKKPESLTEVGQKLGISFLSAKNITDRAYNIIRNDDVLVNGYHLFSNEPANAIILIRKYKASINKKFKTLAKQKEKEEQRQTIYEYFSEYSKEEIDAALYEFKEKQINHLRMKFGFDLCHPTGIALGEENYRKYYYALSKLKDKLQENREKAKREREKILKIDTSQKESVVEFMRTLPIYKAIERFGLSDSIITYLAFGYFGDRVFSPDFLATTLDKDINEINEIIGRNLSIYGDDLPNHIDDVVSNIKRTKK